MCSAFKNEVILLVILSVIIFPSYVTLNYTYFPINVRTCDVTPDVSDPLKVQSVFMAADDDTSSSPCTLRTHELEVRVGFQIYALSLMTFVGWLLLCIFLPTGMQAFPFDQVA